MIMPPIILRHLNTWSLVVETICGGFAGRSVLLSVFWDFKSHMPFNWLCLFSAYDLRCELSASSCTHHACSLTSLPLWIQTQKKLFCKLCLLYYHSRRKITNIEFGTKKWGLPVKIWPCGVWLFEGFFEECGRIWDCGL